MENLTLHKTYFKPEDVSPCPADRIWKINQEFIQRVDAVEYPCVGAKSALNTSHYRLGSYGSMADPETTAHLADDLRTYIEDTLSSNSKYMSMIAVFTDEITSELDFEEKLWKQLQSLHDTEENVKWDPSVSSDPDDKNFSFSFNGYAFFVVGLHPMSSRKARQFGFPAMAFNLHHQFEQLRENGVYDKMKKVIREREVSFDGSINPMLTDHGEGLEAPQYSGRKVDSSWKCPFHNLH
ncbi:MAG: guanitoxin biosynthesis heme-dependent pre-guanitoxin N-hydroxylase GntA [Pedobacter sp.]